MRTRLIIALTAIFAMVLATPAAAVTPPSGTATTDLLGVELEIDGVSVLDIDDVVLRALEIATSAEVDEGTVALIDALPAAVNGTDHGRTSVRSDNGEDTSDSTTAVDLLGLIDVGVLNLSATTTDDTARAVVSTADDVVTELPIIGDAGISLSALASLSEVTTESSTGQVGLTFDGLDLGLDDLLGDALADLPLDVLLDLAGALLGTDIGGLGDLDNALSAVEDLLGDLAGEVGDIDGALGDLASSLATVESLQALVTELSADLSEAQSIASTAESLTLTSTIAAVNGAINDYNALLADYPDAGLSSIGTLGSLLDLDLNLLTTLESRTSSLVSHISGLLSSAQSDLTGALSALSSDADLVEGLFGTIDGLLGDLVGALEDLVDTLVGDLLGLVDTLVGDLTDASLLDLSEISVGMSAFADAEDATATLDCTLGGSAVDCLETASGVGGLVSDTLDTLGEVLGILGGGLEVPGITLEIFGVSETVTDTDGETNSAEATLEILRLEVPSVSLDDLVGDTLDGLLGDLLDGRLDVIADLEDAIDGISSSLLGDVEDLVSGVDLTGTLGDIETGIGDVDALVGQVAGLLDDLEGAILGDVATGLSTPGVKLVIDPTVTASYTPGDAPVDAGPVPGDDPTAPSPDDGDPAALPTTGGGMALLGMLLIAGAAMLRRRLAPLP